MERIKVSIGKTYNMGNYESLRLDVGLERDIVDAADLVRAFRVAKGEVRKMLSELEEEWNATRRKS